MGTKIQGKLLYASLVAMVMAVMLAMAGMGNAFAAEHNEKGNADGFKYEQLEQTGMFTENVYTILNMSIESNIFTCRYLYQDPVYNVYLGYSVNGSQTTVFDLSASEYSSYDRGDKNKINSGFSYDVDLSTLDLEDGDIIAFYAYVDYNNDKEDPTFHMTTTYKVVGGVELATSSCLDFSLHFRASGIQATGFKDYKEAFDAMNEN